jgi:Aromatic-ring hydroxylase, C-terminal
VWLTRDGRRLSTHDLFDGRFVLLSASDTWLAAGRDVAAKLGVPFAAELVADPSWAPIYEVGDAGAVLVRPDALPRRWRSFWV